MYAEKGKELGSFYLHFYSKMRAKDALTFIQNTPNQFTNVELISHKKEIGTNQNAPSTESNEQKKGAIKKDQNYTDDEGFTIIKKK